MFRKHYKYLTNDIEKYVFKKKSLINTFLFLSIGHCHLKTVWNPKQYFYHYRMSLLPKKIF